MSVTDSTSVAAKPAEVFVIFGISGDLAKVMTFHSLYRLEARGLLDCPIIGVAVDKWSQDDLHEHARVAILSGGEKIDDEVFDRLTGRMSYIPGDFGDADTYRRVGAAIGDVATPVFYLEIPPFLFGTVIKGLADAGLVRGGRVVVEKPFGHDLASAKELADELHRSVPEPQLFRIDHFLGKLGSDELQYLRFANTILEPIWNRSFVESVQLTMAESFGVEDRGHFYDPVGALRDVVVNHLMQLLSIGAMEAPAGPDPDTVKNAQVALWKAVATADPAHYVRGQYDGYQQIAGVAAGSTTETYAALRLDIDNWRWSGVPFFIRTGKCLPLTQTELRLVFRRPPRLGTQLPFHRAPEANQIVIRLDPSTGVRFRLEARPADAPDPDTITLDREFAKEGASAPAPYEVLLHAALVGDSTRFTRQDGVEETWRIMQPLLDAPSPVQPYAKGSMGPAAADQLIAEFGGWHKPWSN
ncbi:glucose-6-phosphate 1-dehydrogenase 1 [Rhizocola hellebori]|uniref:Glucose-6-phosphate 1-dehydrogenase n=1 Tax=Rhizocola hellebori TaxID=1392758 RepID=A0A8J3Q551_9ACTN|nr:glucose-6-phosphate dehydrogenase [Rhizocola hellebori]GIH03604.1 glucose-6-phosphate 1-dehydrogenase 1 [Rhizocola hellebori]